MNDAKEEIRSKLAIEDVIGEYVQLKRAGRYWRGLSPFTNEKTPSFFVTPERDIWHDFSSGQGGDIFSFIMAVEGVDFRGAMEILARKAGVDLSKYDSRASRSLAAQKERYYKMNDLAVNYFQRQMTESPVAINYVFKKRALSKETVLQWGIGYAPDRPDLVRLLEAKGYRSDEIRGVGLASYRGGEMYRGRMMIPLRDGQGQVVGFTGRIIGDGQPKYLNTPATILYDKGRQLFGLNFAKKAIRDNDFSVVVEGNLDVITSHQAGIKNVVGVAGTALTAYHLKSLGRLSNDVRFCFDSDRAGVAATERAIKLAENLNLKLSVIDYSGLGAKDPDELIKQDPQLWLTALKQHKPAVEWVMDRYAEMEDLDTAEGRKVLTTKTLAIIAHLADPVEQEFYLKKLSTMAQTSLEALKRKMVGEERDESAPRPRLRTVKAPRQSVSNLERDELYYLNMILALTYQYDKLRPLLANLPDSYLPEDLLVVKQTLLGERPLPPNGLPSPVADKLAELKMIAEQAKIAPGSEQGRLLDVMCNLEKRKTKSRFEKLNAELAVTIDTGNIARGQELDPLVKAAQAEQNLVMDSGVRDNYDGLKKLWQQRQLTAKRRAD